MKKLAVFGLLALAGCIDITHYISFNDKGQTVSSIQFGFSAALLESGKDTEELKGKLSDITNGAFSINTKDTNIKGTNFIVSNSVIYGFQSRLTAPKHYFAAADGQGFFPVKEKYGFSLLLGDSLKNSEALKEIQEDAPNPEMGALVAMMFKYRILLSKADLPRPLIKAALTSSKGAEIELPVADYDTVYLIDVPFNSMMESQKIEFHFAPK